MKQAEDFDLLCEWPVATLNGKQEHEIPCRVVAAFVTQNNLSARMNYPVNQAVHSKRGPARCLVKNLDFVVYFVRARHVG